MKLFFFYIFLALTATLCSQVEQFKQFGRGSLNAILSSLVEICQVVMEEICLKFFSIFCCGRHFVDWLQSFLFYIYFSLSLHYFFYQDPL